MSRNVTSTVDQTSIEIRLQRSQLELPELIKMNLGKQPKSAREVETTHVIFTAAAQLAAVVELELCCCLSVCRRLVCVTHVIYIYAPRIILLSPDLEPFPVCS